MMVQMVTGYRAFSPGLDACVTQLSLKSSEQAGTPLHQDAFLNAFVFGPEAQHTLDMSGAYT